MFNLDAMPINFRVIGFGPETEDAITQLSNLGYNEFTAEIFNPEQTQCVTSDDRMVILLISGQSEEAVKISESFKEAGVLTLAVCTEGIEIPSGYVDSQTNVSVNKMYAVAKIILDVIFIPSMIALDFNDIDKTLRNSTIFNAIEGIGYGENRVSDAMNQLNAKCMMSESKNVMLCLYYNAESSSLLVMSELQSVIEVANKLLYLTHISWGVSNDHTLSDGAVRLTLTTTIAKK